MEGSKDVCLGDCVRRDDTSTCGRKLGWDDGEWMEGWEEGGRAVEEWHTVWKEDDCEQGQVEHRETWRTGEYGVRREGCQGGSLISLQERTPSQ